MKKIVKSSTLIMMVAILFGSCSKNETVQPISHNEEIASEHNLKASNWQRVYTENFDNNDSWNRWSRTERFDYNSNKCYYVSSNPYIGYNDNKTCLVLTATKNGSIWNSGHVKSYYEFKPGVNQEYHVVADIKVVAKNGDQWLGFNSTYGVWPAFWTVQENAWPTKGEIDIMEGYSFGGRSKFASNLFYGHSSGQNLLGTTCEREYPVGEGWHRYEQYWKNENGWVTVTIVVDGQVRSSYTNSVNGNLQLQNFGPHNIILNLNVGSNYNIFNNDWINVFSQTMMWVDFVNVDMRYL